MSNNITSAEAMINYMFDPSLDNFVTFLDTTVEEKAEQARSLSPEAAASYEEGALSIIGVFSGAMQAFLQGIEEISGPGAPEAEAAAVMLEGVQEFANKYLITLRDAVFEAKGTTVQVERDARDAREEQAIADLIGSLVGTGV